MVNGTAMELGGLDGKIRSMTRDFEDTLNWRRIIVEGDNPDILCCYEVDRYFT